MTDDDLPKLTVCEDYYTLCDDRYRLAEAGMCGEKQAYLLMDTKTGARLGRFLVLSEARFWLADYIMYGSSDPVVIAATAAERERIATALSSVRAMAVALDAEIFDLALERHTSVSTTGKEILFRMRDIGRTIVQTVDAMAGKL